MLEKLIEALVQGGALGGVCGLLILYFGKKLDQLEVKVGAKLDRVHTAIIDLTKEVIRESKDR